MTPAATTRDPEQPGMERLTLHVQYGTARSGVPAVRSIRDWAELALAAVREPAELSVRIVGEEEGARLNRRWRNRDHATNVLSFEAVPPPGAVPRPLGDIVICAPVVLREARQQGKDPRAHWAHMLLHGALHLLGHDHELPEEARIMEAKERRLMARLGFADPYAAAAS